jgi:hypothetical protein
MTGIFDGVGCNLIVPRFFKLTGTGTRLVFGMFFIAFQG